MYGIRQTDRTAYDGIIQEIDEQEVKDGIVIVEQFIQAIHNEISISIG